MSNPSLYLAVAVLALIVAFWLALQIIGLLFKLFFFAAIFVLGLAAYRVWRSPSER